MLVRDLVVAHHHDRAGGLDGEALADRAEEVRREPAVTACPDDDEVGARRGHVAQQVAGRADGEVLAQLDGRDGPLRDREALVEHLATGDPQVVPVDRERRAAVADVAGGDTARVHDQQRPRHRGRVPCGPGQSNLAVRGAVVADGHASTCLCRRHASTLLRERGGGQGRTMGPDGTFGLLPGSALSPRSPWRTRRRRTARR